MTVNVFVVVTNLKIIMRYYSESQTYKKE